MLTTATLLAAATAAQGGCSHYRLSRLLDVPEKTVQRWSTGRTIPEDKNAAALAELAGLDPAEAVAWIRAERASEPAMRDLWQRAAERLAATAAAALLGVFVTGGPDAGAAVRTDLAAATVKIMSTARRALDRLAASLFGWRRHPPAGVAFA
jgi:hypothetical protein